MTVMQQLKSKSFSSANFTGIFIKCKTSVGANWDGPIIIENTRTSKMNDNGNTWKIYTKNDTLEKYKIHKNIKNDNRFRIHPPL